MVCVGGYMHHFSKPKDYNWYPAQRDGEYDGEYDVQLVVEKATNANAVSNKRGTTKQTAENTKSK